MHMPRGGIFKADSSKKKEKKTFSGSKTSLQAGFASTDFSFRI